MSEIEKLYKLAEIEPDIDYICDIEPDGSHSCDRIESYPEFTAEKQLELIKWFIHSRHFSPVRFNIQWAADSIASYINYLWQDLTEEQKQQVKEILE